MQELIQAANWGLLAIGGLLALGWSLTYLNRHWGPEPQPLIPDRRPAVTPGDAQTAVIHLIMLPLAFFILAALLQTQMPKAEPGQSIAPGSHLWHLAQTQDQAAKMIIVLLMFHLLRTQRLFAEPPPKWPAGRTVLASIPLAISSTSVCTALLAVSAWVVAWFMPDQPSHPVLRGLDHSAWGEWGKLQLAVGAIIVTPLFEEFFFRGILLRAIWFVNQRAWIAVLVSAGFFGLIHQGVPQHVFPLAVFGAILAVIRFRTGSLSLCVLIHALFNLRPFILIWFGGEHVDG